MAGAQTSATGGLEAVRDRTVLVSERHLTMRVDDPALATERIVRIASDRGGELAGQKGQLVIVRLPPGALEGALEAVEDLGEVTARKASARDATLERAQIEADIRGAERSRARVAALVSRTKNVDEALVVERRLAAMDARIDQLKQSKRALDRRAVMIELHVLLQRRRPITRIPRTQLPFAWLGSLSLPILLDNRAEPVRPPRSLESNVDIALQLELPFLVDRPKRDETSNAGIAAMRMRGSDTDPVGFAAGVDAAIGGGQGFVYELGFLVGLGTAVGDFLTLGALGGVGVSGWTGDRVPSSIELPAELFTLVDIDESVRLALYSQIRWTPTSDARQEGAQLTALTDEIDFGGALIVPWLFDNSRLEQGGMRLGFEYSELVGSKRYLFSLGIGFGLPDY